MGSKCFVLYPEANGIIYLLTAMTLQRKRGLHPNRSPERQNINYENSLILFFVRQPLHGNLYTHSFFYKTGIHIVTVDFIFSHDRN